MEPCEHELASFVTYQGSILWICRICYLRDNGGITWKWGCLKDESTDCVDCLEEARAFYARIIRDQEICQTDGPPTFFERWVMRVWNLRQFNVKKDALAREQERFVSAVLMKNFQRRQRQTGAFS